MLGHLGIRLWTIYFESEAGPITSLGLRGTTWSKCDPTDLGDDGKGNPYYIDAAFRSYGSVENSLQDYVDFLEGSYYVGVHRSNTKNYKDATAALTGVYATDTTYGDKLNSIIEQYQLTIYDTY